MHLPLSPAGLLNFIQSRVRKGTAPFCICPFRYLWPIRQDLTKRFFLCLFSIGAHLPARGDVSHKNRRIGRGIFGAAVT